MKKVSIIGAGQLGSRHLQGLKTAQTEMEIWVIDASNESLEVAKERCEAIDATTPKKVHYAQTIEELPEEMDLVIIATGSKPRASIIKSLLLRCTVKNLVLEKVLFPLLSDYDEIGNLLKEKDVKCWVNCPRRMYGMYQQIAAMINKKLPLSMVYEDENWGMCCNSIHEIDIFMYLTGDTSYIIDTSKVNNEIETSKRSGYIEMTGSLKVTTPKGNELVLTSENGFKGKSGITILNGATKFFIDETHGFWDEGEERHEFKMPYQSQLSGILADDVLIKGNCSLSTFEQSTSYHKPFIAALLEKYNNIIKDKENKLLPIT